MSEENAPKLRLKPKLAADPASGPPPPAANAPATEAPSSAADETKIIRLKPKLAPAPPQSDPAGAGPQTSAISGNDFPPPAANPAPEEATSESEKPAVRFSLKPKVAAEPAFTEIPPVSIPAASEELPADAPIPPPDFVNPEEGLSGGTAIPRILTARPFPPPPGNFPAPPAGGVRPAPPWARSARRPAGKKGILAPLGAAIVLLLVVGGGVMAYNKFMAPPPPAPAVVATKPTVHPPTVQHAAESPKQAVAVTAAVNTNSTPTPPAASVTSQAKTTEAPVALTPDAVVILPPPPASPAFKAWAENLKIGGVRTGTATRVFIGGTAYALGEVVNSQLGVTFVGYSSETHMLTFKDKTGAVIDRRN
jgi:hypothetical protein